MKRHSPSQFVVAASGAGTSGDTVAAQAGDCALCGGPIAAGESTLKTKGVFGPGFNNKLDARRPQSPMVCGSCATVMTTIFLTKYSKCLVTADGLHKLASNAHQAHFILNPPKPPFVAYISDSKMQHIIWRSEVTYSRELVFLRYGDRQMSWNPKDVKRAFESAQELARAMSLAGIKGKIPFSSIDRELKSAYGTALRFDVLKLADANPELKPHVSVLEALTISELWAVGILLMSDPEKIEPPTRVDYTSRPAKADDEEADETEEAETT